MAGDHNSSRSNTTSTKVDGEKQKDKPTFEEVSGGGGGSGSEQVPGEPLIVNGEKQKDKPTFEEVSGGGNNSNSRRITRHFSKRFGFYRHEFIRHLRQKHDTAKASINNSKSK